MMHRLAHRSTRGVLAALCCAVVLGGCAFGAAKASKDSPLREGRRLARYTVVAKEAPNTLVADNQFRCRVDAEKYRDVGIGDRVWCLWE